MSDDYQWKQEKPEDGVIPLGPSEGNTDVSAEAEETILPDMQNGQDSGSEELIQGGPLPAEAVQPDSAEESAGTADAEEEPLPEQAAQPVEDTDQAEEFHETERDAEKEQTENREVPHSEEAPAYQDRQVSQQPAQPSQEQPPYHPYGAPNSQQGYQPPNYGQPNPYQQQYQQWQNGYYQQGYQQQPYQPYGGQQPYRQPYQQQYYYGQQSPGQQNPVSGGTSGQPGYSPYGKRQDQPAYQQYQQKYEPYDTQNQPYGGQPPHPPKKSGGMKVFWAILISVAAVFVVGFCGYGIWVSLNGTAPQTAPSSSQAPESGEPGASSSEPDVPDNDSSMVPAPGGDVTNPDSSGIVLESRPSTQELKASEVYKKVAPSIVCILASTETGSGTGSGIIVSEDGYIASNSHVINDSRATKVQVLLFDGRQYEATVVGIDKITDLAILKIDAENLPTAVFGDSDQLMVGDDVVAIGNPSGVEYASSMTRGMISGLDRTVSYSDASNMTYIQTDAAISPGNSGGALVNFYGQVVGITSSKISGVSYEGLSFAIPMTKAKPILDDLIANGYVSGRTRLGITGSSVTQQEQMYGVPAGVRIASIEEGSSLEGTEARPGDIITRIDGKDISGMSQLYQVLGLHKPGDQVQMTLYRVDEFTNRGIDIEITITLLADNGETQALDSSLQ